MRHLKITAYLVGVLASLAYILNPGAGVFELLPDNMPIVGNLDEATMAALLLYCLKALRSLRSIEAQGQAAPAQHSF